MNEPGIPSERCTLTKISSGRAPLARIPAYPGGRHGGRRCAVAGQLGPDHQRHPDRYADRSRSLSCALVVIGWENRTSAFETVLGVRQSIGVSSVSSLVERREIAFVLVQAPTFG